MNGLEGDCWSDLLLRIAEKFFQASRGLLGPVDYGKQKVMGLEVRWGQCFPWADRGWWWLTLLFVPYSILLWKIFKNTTSVKRILHWTPISTPHILPAVNVLLYLSCLFLFIHPSTHLIFLVHFKVHCQHQFTTP